MKKINSLEELDELVEEGEKFIYQGNVFVKYQDNAIPLIVPDPATYH